jgi:uncharacterized protein
VEKALRLTYEIPYDGLVNNPILGIVIPEVRFVQELQTMQLHGFEHGIKLINQGAYFEAHEALEDVWRIAPPGEKKFLQGLIQVAVALHHHSQGNLAGAKSLLVRGIGNLAGYPDRFAGIRLDRLKENLSIWQKALESGTATPSAPQVEMAEELSDPD